MLSLACMLFAAPPPREVEPAFNRRMLKLVHELHAQDPVKFAGVDFKKAPLKRLERILEKTKEDWPLFLRQSCLALGDAAKHEAPQGLSSKLWNEVVQHRYVLGSQEHKFWEDYGKIVDVVRGSISCANEDQVRTIRFEDGRSVVEYICVEK